MKKTDLALFNIGFEFEFTINAKGIPKSMFSSLRAYRLDDLFDSFLEKMYTYFPERNWKKICDYREDSSISKKSGFEALEVITRKLPGNEALAVAQEILLVLSTPTFSINESCGLHFNVSFIKDMPNVQTLAYQMSKKLDIDSINQRFKRLGNEHCQPNLDTTIHKEDLGDILSKAFISSQTNQRPHEISYMNVHRFLTGLQQNKIVFEKFIQITEQGLLLQSEDEWTGNRPAIAPKTRKNNGVGSSYLEFRSMGGTNYPRKLDLIGQTIIEFLECMIETRKNIQKSKNNGKISV